jgi:hypothetical protein
MPQLDAWSVFPSAETARSLVSVSGSAPGRAVHGRRSMFGWGRTIWRTTDNGATWRPWLDGVAASTFVVDGVHPRTFYVQSAVRALEHAGVGRQGIGNLRIPRSIAKSATVPPNGPVLVHCPAAGVAATAATMPATAIQARPTDTLPSNCPKSRKSTHVH